jgi:purine-binding chemotaxis protein CheW
MDDFNSRAETIVEAEDTQKDKFLTFVIGQETYGIDILFVTEIVGLQPITILPEFPAYMKGIINLRGRIIPVMDVRLRFKQAAQDYNERTCIIIVNSGAINLGLIVDAVAEVLTIPERDIVAPPLLQGEAANRYIKAIGKVEDQVKLLLNCDELVTAETMDALREAI